MITFIPGKMIKQFTSKKGNAVTLRYLQWSDLEQMTQYINRLSAEDTFITFSGEVISTADEAKYLSSLFVDFEFGNKVVVAAFMEDMLVGSCDVARDIANKERRKHVGALGISIKKEYRGEGLGEELMRTAIAEAQKYILGLRIITLHVYGKNDIAQSLYKKIGFIEYARLPEGVKYKDEFIDDISMYLPLA